MAFFSTRPLHHFSVRLHSQQATTPGQVAQARAKPIERVTGARNHPRQPLIDNL